MKTALHYIGFAAGIILPPPGISAGLDQLHAAVAPTSTLFDAETNVSLLSPYPAAFTILAHSSADMVQASRHKRHRHGHERHQ